MTEEAQKKIRGMVDLTMSYVVEPQPLSVPAVGETMDALVERLTSGLTLKDETSQDQQEEEVWDGELFGVRLGKRRVLFFLITPAVRKKPQIAFTMCASVFFY